MTIKTLPAAPAAGFSARAQFPVPQSALDRWQPLQASDKADDRTISVFDVIGQDFWTGEGVTAKRVSAALRSLGSGPVTVNVNSPGGDLFEGLAIYNLLREHKGEVTVKVLGVAASAASIIAMAGDRVEIARAGFLMIHNTWVMAVGNRNDMREIADQLEPFDRAMADIYAARTGMDPKAAGKLMDKETWIGGADAVDQGFADALLAADAVEPGEKSKARAERRMEAALRASGLPKSEAMTLISEIKTGGAGDPPAGRGEGDPADGALPSLSATAALAASLTTLINS